MRFLLVVIIALFSNVPLFAQEKKMRVYMDTKQFYAPEIGHLLEVSLQFSGPSLNYKGVAGGLMGEVAVFLTLEQNGVPVQDDGYRLSSPLMKDSIVEDFYDLKRFVVAPGEYTLQIELQDLLSAQPSVKGSSKIIVSDLSVKTGMSNILIAEMANPGREQSIFFKSGYEIIPRISNYFPSELNNLPYYVEIYKTSLLQSEDFGLKQTIIDAETEEEIEKFTQFYRLKPGAVVPVLKKVDISELGTGTYFLQLTLLSKDMTEVYKEAYKFDRYNEIEIDLSTENIVLDPAFAESCTLDSVRFFLGSLLPISTPESSRKIMDALRNNNNAESQLLLQSFWMATSQSKAYDEWIKYKAQVLLVQKLYRTNFQDGYETDRGRVYLQYGSPTNIIQREVSASEYPYEIWQYNKIGKFSNKRFIFYNTDLSGENYRLLHSDMLGEIKNSNWPHALNSRNSTNGTVDDGNAGVQEHYGGSSNTYYRQY